MKLICELSDKVILGQDGMSEKSPRLTARAIVKNQDGLYAVMYSDKFKLHSLPGGGVEDGEDVLTAPRREVYEETGCTCDDVTELGVVTENRGGLDYTQVNYYYVVTATHTPGENHLTEAEQASGTVLQWHAFDEMVRLIHAQEFEQVQRKYLKARDVAALQEYSRLVQGECGRKG
ncbi:MAG: NUDIX domain-containing protein [Clostridiales bacterium]|nr:NUDIX domain-containing protein [Clostridiales bacterium]